MQRVAVLTLALTGSLAAASRLHRSQGRLVTDEQAGHPVEKVIGLLKDLKKEVKAQAQEEEYIYGKFQKWCQDKEKIDSLKDKVSSLEKEETTRSWSTRKPKRRPR